MIATIALLGWPIVAIWLFISRTLTQAIIWTILGGYLILPSGSVIKIPMVPGFDKQTIPALCALVGCLAVSTAKRSWFSLSVPSLLIGALIISPFLTSQLNGDLIVIGSTILPGVGSYDGFSAAISQLIAFIPFILGRQYIRSSNDTKEFLRATVTGGLLYSIPSLLEVKFSPQLSNWVYGYFASSFATESRYGGFRPVVFLENGLVLSFFMLTAFVAAITFVRTKNNFWILPRSIVPAYLAAVLILCKTAGTLLLGSVLGLALLIFRPQLQMKIACVVAIVALSYPIMRALDVFPDTTLVSIASSFDEERAQSLQFRFDQEDKLLKHALERPFFGWGRFGRNRVFNESGQDESITDGLWIIWIGQFGIVGFIALFGLLAGPVFYSFAAFKYTQSYNEQLFLATLTIVVAIRVIDQLPNSSLSGWVWLTAGTLLGRSEAILQSSRYLAMQASHHKDRHSFTGS